MGGKSMGYFFVCRNKNKLILLSLWHFFTNFAAQYETGMQGILVRTLPPNMKQACREYLHVTNLIK